MAEFLAAAEAAASAFGTWAASAAGSMTAWNVIQAAIIVGGLIQAQKARSAARRAAEQASINSENRTVTFRSSDAVRTLVYGRTRVAGPIVGVWSHGGTKEYLSVVVALGGHEFDAIEDVWFNDKSIGSLDGSGYVTSTSDYWKHNSIPATNAANVHPGQSNSITMPADAYYIDSIVTTDAIAPDSEANPLQTLAGGVDWGFNTVTKQLTLLSNTGVGRYMNITYRRETGRALVRVKKFVGSASGHTDSDLNTDSGGQWTNNHLGKGVPRLHIRLEYDNDVFGPISVPNFSAIVRGKKVFDWVALNTTWSQNSARCCADYITSSMGFNTPIGEIVSSFMITAQNVCDEDVTLTTAGTQKRYTCNGVIFTDANRRDNLEQILLSMAGNANPASGNWIIRAGAYVTPTLTLDDSDLANSRSTVQPISDRSSLYNGVTGRYINSTVQGLYQSDTFKPYSSATYIAQDGGEIIDTEITLALVDDNERAQRIAKLLLFKHRQPLVYIAQWSMAAYELQAGDTCRVKSARYGWTAIDSGQGKVFLVLDRQLNLDGTIVLTMQEEASAIYAWNFSEAVIPDASPNTTLPKPGFVDGLKNLRVTTSATTIEAYTDGSKVAYALAQWNAVTDRAVLDGGKIHFWYKRGNALTYTEAIIEPTQTQFKIEGVSPEEIINYYARTYNASGARSEPEFGTHIVSSSLIGLVSTTPYSANLLFNSSMTNGSAGTSVGWEPGMTDQVVWASDSGCITSDPASRVLYQAGNQVKYSFVSWKPFTAKVGTTYCAFGGVLPIRCTGRVQLTWFDANNNPLPTGNIIPPTVPNYSGLGFSPLKSAEYPIVGGFGIAPVGASTGLFQAVNLGTVAGQANSGMFVHKPLVGEVKAGTTVFPLWNHGPESVNYDQMEAFAATGVLEENFESSFTGEANYSSAVSRRVCVANFVSPVTCPASVAGWVIASQGSGTYAALRITFGGTVPSWSKTVTAPGTPPTPALTPYLPFLSRSTGRAQMTGHAQATMSLVAGTSYNIGISVDSDSDWPHTSVTLSEVLKAHLRIELMKK